MVSTPYPKDGNQYLLIFSLGDRHIMIAEASRNSTIGEIKSMISAKEGIPVNQMILTQAGNRLQDDKPLSTYPVAIPNAEPVILFIEDSAGFPMSQLDAPYEGVMMESVGVGSGDSDVEVSLSDGPESFDEEAPSLDDSRHEVRAGAVYDEEDEEDGMASHVDVVQKLIAKWTTVYDDAED